MLDYEPIPTPKARYAAETIPRPSPYSATETNQLMYHIMLQKYYAAETTPGRARRQTEDEY